MEGSKGCQELGSSLTVCVVCSRVGRLRPKGSRSELGGPVVGSVDVDLVSLGFQKSILPFGGGSASPFIDEGDGLTSERGRVYVCY